MDQPAGLVTKMMKLGVVYQAMKAYRRCDKNSKKLKDEYGDQIYSLVVRIRKEIIDGNSD